jgi:serine O-acetyltransferase
LKRISLKETFKRLNMDIEIYAKYSLAGRITIKKWLSIFFIPSIQTMFLYRLSYFFFIKNYRIISRIFYNINIVLFGADIGMSSEINGGCYIPHPVGVVIYGMVGKNAILSQNVGIGGGTKYDLNIGAGPGLPIIEDNVYVGAKSTIAGPIRIGKGSLIGFHSLVIKDVPQNTIVRGTPARNIRQLKPGELQMLTNSPHTS